MKLKCKAYIDIPDLISGYHLNLKIDIKQPYISIFGKQKTKNKNTHFTLVRGYEGYKQFLDDCIEYLNKEGVKEEMINDAKQAVKNMYGVSDEQLEMNKKENELVSLTKKYNLEFEVEV
jgi:hypothetical protein